MNAQHQCPKCHCSQEPRRLRLNKTVLGCACLPLALLLISVIVFAVNVVDELTTPTPLSDKPSYMIYDKVEEKNTGRTDLVVPEATVDQAKAAITDYAKRINGQQNYGITVVRNRADKVYVCRGEWVKDERAAEIYTAGRITSDTWPALDINCPGSAGS